ncbi:MAG: galactokinase [Lachnospiraceae bacterium]|nr:galactokinase [Lachnospiraceae bacterium]
MKKELIDEFEKIFGDSVGVSVYFAPGRVNLIGEHTDYNGGHVFPCALTIGTYAVVRKRDDRELNFSSMNFPDSGVVKTSLDDMRPKADDSWTAYPKGVIWAFNGRGYDIPIGLDVLIYGTIPAGSGLSSSASLEVLTGEFLRDQFGLNEVTNVDLAKIGQYSENNYNGMNCGIMDQFASAMGKKDNAIFLDTATLEFEYAPIALKDACIIVTNSNVKHSLVGSDYNTRRAECEEALAELKKVVDIESLGDLDEATFEANKSVITKDNCRARAKHAVYENRRTIKAVKALKDGDVEAFGKLMNEAHTSMSVDYAASCPEVDILVEAAWKIGGVLGSRITGGGFGGCSVSIVRNSAVEKFKFEVAAEYEAKTGLKADFYVVSIGDGPLKL